MGECRSGFCRFLVVGCCCLAERLPLLNRYRLHLFVPVSIFDTGCCWAMPIYANKIKNTQIELASRLLHHLWCGQKVLTPIFPFSTKTPPTWRDPWAAWTMVTMAPAKQQHGFIVFTLANQSNQSNPQIMHQHGIFIHAIICVWKQI